MPTYGDETLHDRYAREHADHMTRLAKMTPEQIAEMELDLHNALAEVDRLRAQASQGGEAVEVVAHLVLGGIFHGGSGPELGDIDYQIEVGVAERLQLENVKTSQDVQLELMTVAQHQRIVAALTPPSPDAKIVELLRSKFPRIDPCQPVPLDEKAHCCEYTIYVERERLHRIIDAKMASLEVKL